jgi:hypothetical protein
LYEIRGWPDPEAEGRRTILRLIKAALFLIPLFWVAFVLMIRATVMGLGRAFESLSYYYFP